MIHAVYKCQSSVKFTLHLRTRCTLGVRVVLYKSDFTTEKIV